MPVVLAIDPGTRLTGYALFEGQELIMGRVKDFGFQRSTRELLELSDKLVSDLLRRFEPEVLVIEKTFLYKYKNSSKLIVLATEIRTLAEAHGVPVVEYAARTARKIVIGDGNIVKQGVAEAICRRYPELSIHLKQTHVWKESYWNNMYDATCLGLAYLIEENLAPPLRHSA